MQQSGQGLVLNGGLERWHGEFIFIVIAEILVYLDSPVSVLGDEYLALISNEYPHRKDMHAWVRSEEHTSELQSR